MAVLIEMFLDARPRKFMGVVSHNMGEPEGLRT